MLMHGDDLRPLFGQQFYSVMKKRILILVKQTTKIRSMTQSLRLRVSLGLFFKGDKLPE